MAVDDTRRLQTRGSGTERGGMVGEIEGYLWMPRRSANVRGEEEATAAVGGAMKRKWCVLCRSTFLLGEASKIWEVVRKSLGSR